MKARILFNVLEASTDQSCSLRALLRFQKRNVIDEAGGRSAAVYFRSQPKASWKAEMSVRGACVGVERSEMERMLLLLRAQATAAWRVKIVIVVDTFS